jgi:hypothetical protein
MNGIVSVPTQLTSDNSTRVATTAYVTNKVSALTGATASFTNDVAVGNRLLVTSDVSFNGKMFVNGDVSMNGSISVPTQLTSDNSSKVASTAFVTNKVASITGSSAGFINDVNITNRLFVGSDVSFNGKMYVSGDVSMNGIISVPTQLSSDNSTRVATTAFVTNKIAGFSTSNFTSDVSMNRRLNVLSDVSLNQRLFVGGDASFNGNVYVSGNIIANYTANSIPSSAIIGGITPSNFTNDVSMDKRLFVNGEAIFDNAVNINLTNNLGKSNWINASPSTITTQPIANIQISQDGQYAIAGSSNSLFGNTVGIFYSTNYGQIWNQSNIDFYNGWQTASSADGKYAIAAPWNSLGYHYYSSTYGQTWIASNLNNVSDTVLSMSGNGVYALTISGYYSSNYGQSWLSLGLGSLGTTSMSYTGQYALSVQSNLLKYSSTYGVTWITPVLTTGGNVTGIWTVQIFAPGSGVPYAVASNNTTGVYYSTTYGYSWTQSNITNLAFRHIAMTTTGQYVVAGAYGTSNLYVSTSYGVYWSYISNNVSFTSPINNLAMSGDGKYILYGGYDGIKYIINSYYNNFGIYNTLPSCVIDISGASQFNGDINMNKRLFATNVGINQSTIANGFALDVNGKMCVRSDLSLNGDSYFTNNKLIVTNTPAIDTTTLINKAWSLSSPSVLNSAAWPTQTISLSDNGYALFGASTSGSVSNGIYYSTNYGQNWIQSNINTDKYTIAASLTGRFAIAGQWNGTQIYYSTNYGISWTLSNANVSNTGWGVAISGNGLYAIVGSRLYSSDGGINWTASTGGMAQVSACSMSYSGQYALSSTSPAGSGSIVFSSTYGRTWTQPIYTSGGTITSGAWYGPAYARDSNSSYAIVSSADVYYSSTYGYSWTRSNLIGIGFSAVTMSLTGQYALGGRVNTSELYMTTNYGAFWTLLTTTSGVSYFPNSNALAVTSDFTYLLYGGVSGIMYKSIPYVYGGVGVGKTATPGVALDVSGATIISGSTLFVSDVSINGRLSFNNISNEIIPPSALNPTTLTTINLNTANTSFSAFFNRANTGLRFEDMKISSDGKYIITCSNTYVHGSYLYSPLPPPAIGYYVHISSNYGNSFYTLNDNPNSWINNLAITSDGKYMAYGIGLSNVGTVTTTTSVPNLYISSNYGNSFFGKIMLRGDGNRSQIVSISITNAGDRIMVAGDGNLYMSTNFGNNFYIAQASDTIIGGTAFNFNTARMSPTTGKYIICIEGGRYGVMSSNYGTSFYRLTGIDFYNPYMGENGGGFYQNSPITFSLDEKYIYLTRYKDFSGIIYRSYDFGVTWSYWDGRQPTMILEEGYVNSLHCTADGKNIVVGTGYTNSGFNGYVYISSNYGVNYSKIITSPGYWAAAISANGEYIYARDMYSSLYKSTAQATYTTNKYLEFNSYDLSMNKRLFVNSIGINTSTITSGFALDVNGNIRYVAATATSDYRVKQNVKPLDETFNVDNLRPVSYYNTLSNNQDVGLIAHELQEYYPSLVHGNKDDDDYQSVNYTSLISVLIHEIQQLKKRIIKLENNTIDPSNNTDPVAPVENIDPVVPTENIDPVVPTENTEPVAPVENTEPVAPTENTEPVAPTENTDENTSV